MTGTPMPSTSEATPIAIHLRPRSPTFRVYPFTEPAVRPRTKYRCNEKNTTMGSTMEMNAAPGRRCSASPLLPARLASATVSTWVLGSRPRNTKATKKSFAIFQFLWVWNDYLVALIFIGSQPDVQVLTMRLAEIVGSRGDDWHLLTAGAFVSLILPLIIFFSLQRYFVRGLVAGSVKA